MDTAEGHNLPAGTVTFLFTDVEGSTRLIEAVGDESAALLTAQHDAITAAVAAHGGHAMESEGDSCSAVFGRAIDGVGAALDAQRALAAGPVRVRFGLHSGDAQLHASGYVGLTVHRAARIRSAAHGGQVLMSAATAELVAGSLPAGAALRDLGEYRLKDLSHRERLFQLLHPDLDEEFPRLQTLDAVPNNLPVELTSFVGREREIDEVKRLLASARLVTLLGPGGAGKTRLALHVGAELFDPYPDGIWLVDLAATSEGSVIPETVATIVGVSRAPQMSGPDQSPADRGSPFLDRILDRLRHRQALLIIDNCEHLVAECAELAERVLRACPQVSVLATSRQPLRVAGEARWHVPPMAVPEADPPASIDGYESVRLFVERARLHRSTFTLTPVTRPVVSEICRTLDGMPLAIELAASWVGTLDARQILDRLDDRFRLLAAEATRAVPRHQTLRATVDWSYDLLSDGERRLLENLSIFAGGFTLDAAEQVCAEDGLDPDDVVHVLSGLVDKSLVVREGEDPVRYRLLEVIRQYGWEKIESSDRGMPIAPTVGSQAVFRREGEYWALRFGTDDVRLRHTKGLGYLHRLIAAPGTEIHVLELASPGAAVDTGDSGDILDPRARDEYKRRVTDLQEELNEARSWSDTERVAALERELDFIADELSGAFGLGGRAKRSGSASERARTSVTKAITGAIAKVETHDARLGGHLRAAVRTGVYCSYRPDPTHQLEWSL